MTSLTTFLCVYYLNIANAAYGMISSMRALHNQFYLLNLFSIIGNINRGGCVLVLSERAQLYRVT